MTAEDPFRLSGKVALVTGSVRGIGRALAEGLAEAGATVVLNGRNVEELTNTHRQLVERFGKDQLHVAAFDITDESAITEALHEVESQVGSVDILVNNAGLQLRKPILELTAQEWDRVITTDLTGAFLVSRQVAGPMIRSGSGKIINICSVQSELARPTIAAYTAAKGGLRNLTKAMAAEWAGQGLQVNAVAPGYLDTEMTSALVADPDFDSWLRARVPAGRWGSPRDIVGPVVWLSSSASDYVNGQVIYVDGGLTAVV